MNYTLNVLLFLKKRAQFTLLCILQVNENEQASRSMNLVLLE